MRVCSVEGCGRKHLARGYCGKHYQGARYHQLIEPVQRRAAKPGEKEAYLRSLLGATIPECIEWPWSISKKGYGSSWVSGKQIEAHRAICMLAHGAPPLRGHHAAHVCGNSICVNPNHIRWATSAQNSADKKQHGSEAFGEGRPNASLTNEQAVAIAADERLDVEIAKEYGISTGIVFAIRRGRTWTTVTGRRRTAGGGYYRGEKMVQAKLTNEQVLAIVKDTRSDAETAMSYGVAKATIGHVRSGKWWGWLTGIRCAHRGPMKGSKNPASKLTEADALAIYRDKRKLTDIAGDYGCSFSNVSMIKTGRAWRHVTGHEQE